MICINYCPVISHACIHFLGKRKKTRKGKIVKGSKKKNGKTIAERERESTHPSPRRRNPNPPNPSPPAKTLIHPPPNRSTRCPLLPPTLDPLPAAVDGNAVSLTKSRFGFLVLADGETSRPRRRRRRREGEVRRRRGVPLLRRPR